MLDPHLPHHLNEIGLIANCVKNFSYFGIFLLSTIVGYVIPIPEAIILILFGYAAGTAKLSIANVLLASIAGGIFGDNIVYRLSFFGNKYVEKFNQKMRSHKLIQYEYLVKNNIGKAIYFLRFITGVRFFGSVISGTLGVRWKKFLFFNGGATFLHTVLFVMLGYSFHHRIIILITEVEVIRNILFLSSFFIIGILLKVFSKKGKSVLK